MKYITSGITSERKRLLSSKLPHPFQQSRHSFLQVNSNNQTRAGTPRPHLKKALMYNLKKEFSIKSYNNKYKGNPIFACVDGYGTNYIFDFF
jgi:hypothetical protein